MRKITREEAIDFLHMRLKDELTKEIRERFDRVGDASPEFWHGALSGLVQAMVLYEHSSLPPEDKQITIVEMIGEASRQFLGIENNGILQ
jgi:hypothetical protein